MAAADAPLAEFVASVGYEGKDASWDEWVVESLKLNDTMVRLLAVVCASWIRLSRFGVAPAKLFRRLS